MVEQLDGKSLERFTNLRLLHRFSEIIVQSCAMVLSYADANFGCVCGCCFHRIGCICKAASF